MQLSSAALLIADVVKECLTLANNADFAFVRQKKRVTEDTIFGRRRL